MKTMFLLLVLFVAAGCNSPRSISDSGYREERFWGGPATGSGGGSFGYRGELNELDVLGIEREALISDTEIERTLDQAMRVRLNTNSSILLVQSGANFPDGPMVSELSRHFRVVPFTGIPFEMEGARDTAAARASRGLSRTLRLAAARGGNDVILCYWGIVESANEKLPGRTISWIPVVNWMTPDQRQHMRLRLKMALVDVRTGDWVMLSPAPVDASRITIAPRRGVTDQKLVEHLKSAAYAEAVTELTRQCGSDHGAK